MRNVGESTRPRTDTSCWRGGRSASPALRGRSEDQPPRSLSPILTLRGWDMARIKRAVPARSVSKLDQSAVGPVERLAVRVRDVDQADAGGDALLELAGLVCEHPGEDLAL